MKLIAFFLVFFRMLLQRHVLSSCLLLLWLCPVRTICPSECTCRLDEKGRRKVTCFLGDMIDPIPVDNMDIGMEILEITAPKDHWNVLALDSVFQIFKKLQEIHILRSNIIQIPMHVFWGVPSLKVLDLRYNNITVVFDHNFRGLVNLVELNLDDNQIDRLPTGAFKHLSELRILTLQRNNLNELVPRLFLKLTKLQVLKISGNPLMELNPEVFKDVLVRIINNYSNFVRINFNSISTHDSFCDNAFTFLCLMQKSCRLIF